MVRARIMRHWDSRRRQGERRIDIDSAEIIRTNLANDDSD